MKFSDLREEFIGYEATCLMAKQQRRPIPPFIIETRQRVNLSDHAQCILLQDLDAFRHRLKIESSRKNLLPEIINYIFRIYCKDAKASIYHACEKKRRELRETLTGLDAGTLERVTDMLTDAYRESLCAEAEWNLARKGESVPIRLDKETLFFLGESKQYGRMECSAIYHDRIGSYFKAVIEEYAQKSYLEREAIFYNKDVETIQEAIREQRMLQITTRNRHLHYVKPYAIQADGEHLYHYLSGHFFSSKDGTWNPGSVRLSLITDCTILPQSGKLSAEEAADLKAAIQKKGIQFLSNAPDSERPQKIVVRFTQEGRKMYHQMLHLRPMYDGVPNGLEYTFITTLRQAENYFFKFGHNVKILEPEVLADKFRRRYESAAKQYK